MYHYQKRCIEIILIKILIFKLHYTFIKTSNKRKKITLVQTFMYTMMNFCRAQDTTISCF